MLLVHANSISSFHPISNATIDINSLAQIKDESSMNGCLMVFVATF